MANIFRVYKDSQVTTDRIRAEAAADSIVIPERVVYVFGTADDVAPNFTTVAGAITYANSLTPIVTEPVVVRLFTKADGTPYDLTGLDSWTDYANDYIYFVSDFVRLNETTTLPTTLPAGQQVWYIDANGVETLWVGREDGSAWPAVGYKEYVAELQQIEENAPTAVIRKNEIGNIVWTREQTGAYNGTLSNAFVNKIDISISNPIGSAEYGSIITTKATNSLIIVLTFDVSESPSDSILGEFFINVLSIRLYPF